MADKVVVKLTVGNDPEQSFTVSPDIIPGVEKALADASYVPVEYPKAVYREGHKDPVIVNSAEEEKALTEPAKAAE